VVTYTLARDVGAESERTCEDFKQFLRDIADAGIVKVTLVFSTLYSALMLTCLTLTTHHMLRQCHIRYCYCNDCGEASMYYGNEHVLGVLYVYNAE
jgi:hypothetical protein